MFQHCRALSMYIIYSCSVTKCEFLSGRTGVWIGFLGISPLFPRHKFHSIISPHPFHSRPHLTHHRRGKCNETKWMRWVWRNGGMKFVAGENGRNPEKTLLKLRFVHHETYMGWPRRELGPSRCGASVCLPTEPTCRARITDMKW